MAIDHECTSMQSGHSAADRNSSKLYTPALKFYHAALYFLFPSSISRKRLFFRSVNALLDFSCLKFHCTGKWGLNCLGMRFGYFPTKIAPQARSAAFKTFQIEGNASHPAQIMMVFIARPSSWAAAATESSSPFITVSVCTSPSSHCYHCFDCLPA